MRLRDAPGQGGAGCEVRWRKRIWWCPRVECEVRTWTEECELAGPRRVLTRRAAQWAVGRLAAVEGTVASAARRLGVAAATVWSSVGDAAQQVADDPERVGAVARLGLDETVAGSAGRLRRRRYVCAAVDAATGQVLDVFDGRDAVDVGRWLASRPPQWLAGIEVVCCDPHEGYRSGITRARRDTHLSDSVNIAADAFAIVRLANQALDSARRRVHNDTTGHRGPKNDPLYQIRKLLLTGAERLDAAGWDKMLTALDAADPADEIRECRVAKEHVRDIFRADDPPRRPTASQRSDRLVRAPQRPARARHPGPHAAPLAHRNRNRRAHPHQQRPHRSSQRTNQPRQTISTRLPQPCQLPAPHPARRRPQTMPNSTRHTNQNPTSQLGCVEPDYSSPRQAVVTHLSNPVLVKTISGLTNDESHTVRVLAYNQNGDGTAAEMTATATATDTTAPTLLLARLHEEHSWVRLIWNETLAVSSVPTSTAFTVNVNGVSRGIDRINVPDGNILNIRLLGAIGVSDSVTVSYTVPTGADARPLKDSARNNAAGFSDKMVRNDRTQVALTSDPGPDMTYVWRNGYGGQDVVEATVTFSEPVVVTGAPELKLDVGGQTRRARYHSGSGSTSLVFRYSVTQFETDTDGISVPHGAHPHGSIQPASLVRYVSTNAVAPPPMKLDPQAGHLVDAVRPFLVSADAVANGSDIALRWDKDLDEDSVPYPLVGFDVQDSSTSTRRTIDSISVAGRVVTLTLSSAISATDQLTVSWGWPDFVYDGVTVDALTDTVGNYAKKTARPLAVSIKQPNRPPEFPSGEDGARGVDENSPAGRNVGTPVRASDDDNDRLIYSISGVDAALFDVAVSSGQLRTKGALNHEANSSYSFTMSVHDGKDIYGNSDSAIDATISVTVTVGDVDEPADISFSASSSVTSSGNTMAVNENHDGTLAAFSASDPESKPGLTYEWSVGGTDRLDFAITDAGVLSFAAVPDFERPADWGGNNVYDIAVSARDSDDNTGTIAVTVTVDPVNERPTITGGAAASIEEEGGLLVGTYRASDPEGALIAWQPLAGVDRDRFEFAASTGRLVFKAAPDYEDAHRLWWRQRL